MCMGSTNDANKDWGREVVVGLNTQVVLDSQQWHLWQEKEDEERRSSEDTSKRGARSCRLLYVLSM